MQITQAKNLACPLDGTALEFNNKQLVCANSHCFDIARQSYVNLLPVQFKKSKDPGDSKAMIVARGEFVSRGYFSNIADKLVEISHIHLADRRDICLLDAGCGEGYFLNCIAQHYNNLDGGGQASFIGLDISKWAIIAASKRTSCITWIVGTNKHIPVLPKSLDVIYSHFGFPIYEEFKKSLKPEGKIILTEAGPEHLIELRNIIYPQLNTARSKSSAVTEYTNLVDSCSLKYTITDMPQQDIHNMLVMTPHLYRASKEGKEAAAKLDRMDLTIDITIKVLNFKPTFS